MAITAGMVKELREKTGLGMMTCKKALSEADGDMTLAIETLRKKGEATAEKRSGKSASEGGVAATVKGSTGTLFQINCETDFSANSDGFVAILSSIADLSADKKPADLNALTALELNGTSIEETLKTLTGKIGEKIEVKDYSSMSANDNEAIYSYIHSNRKIGALVKLSSDNAAILSTDEVVTLGKDIAMQVSAAAPKAINKEDLDPAWVAKEEEIATELLKNEGKPEQIIGKILIGKMAKLYKENTLVGQEFIKADKVSVEAHMNEVAKSVGGSLKIVSIARLELGQSEN